MMKPERDQQRLHKWCIRRLQEDWTIRRVAEHARIPKSTVHDWWMRFQRKGWDGGLLDESRRPHTIHRLPSTTIQRVIQLRQAEGWCHEAIAAYLNQQGLKVSSGSAYTILKRNGLITKPYKPRRQRTFIRFARQHPDSLWQTDIKYYGSEYLIAFLDDCRYLPGANLYPEATTDTVLETLEEALSAGRTPKQILSDHGTQYWSNDGPGRFTTYCTQHGIEHILGFHWKTYNAG